MRISTKGRYAVRIMAELARHTNGNISVAELSKNQEISAKYIEKIISLLTKANLISSTRGAQGGYRLAKSPKKCTVAEILRATDDLPKLVPCLNSSTPCPRREFCDSVSCWDNLTQLINDYLSSITLADLIGKKSS